MKFPRLPHRKVPVLVDGQNPPFDARVPPSQRRFQLCPIDAVVLRIRAAYGPVIQNHHQLEKLWFFGVFNDQRTLESPCNLIQRVMMRMEPMGPGITERDVIGKFLFRIDEGAVEHARDAIHSF